MSVFTILLIIGTTPADLIKSIVSTVETFNNGTSAMVKQTLLIGQALCILFVPLSMGWNIITKSADNLDSGDPAGKWLWDWKEMGRLLVLYTLLNIAYIPVCTLLVKLSLILAQITFTGALKEYLVESETKAHWWQYITGFVDSTVFNIVQGLLNLIARVISYVMWTFSYCVSRILYVFGPLVIAFSIIPAFKNKLAEWFGMFLNCLCVPFTLNVINGVYQAMADGIIPGTSINGAMFLIMNATYIICICLAFWFTSFYVGSSAASKVLSTAAGAVAAVVTMAMKASDKKEEKDKDKDKGGGNPIEK